MNKVKWCSSVMILAIMFASVFPANSFSAEKEKKKDPYEIPSHVLNVSKENTFPNSTEDQEVIEPSELTKELMDELDIKIENPVLIKMLNETSLKPSPIAIGYRGMVYIGRWPLNYESSETTINWEYQQINMNELNNTGGTEAQELRYVQQEQKEIKGALTNKINKPDDVKKMMLLKSKTKTKLPLSYQTVIGKNTKKDNTYNVAANKYAKLQTFAPAVNEKGQVTFGEVYLKLKGSKKSIEIKNVTKQGIGAWIPIQDYVSFSYNVK
ncbi:MAG: YfkD family protein [Bacillota bacterium]|uniref:YfkD famly protein n=1 Tax=Virgibacillus TaxID=84406 RepID=UPI000EF4444A|nr:MULTISPECIES: YfkD famly protein [Virgibacillus]MDY7046484.1 YfkD family protein [Virgibacillus sp. M23]WBX80375.1 YfkD family protein [Virgibacillus salarius]